MPVCKKCNTHFPNKIFIDGKERGIHKRTLCLICSPFGAKKTGIKKKRILSASTKICKICGEKFFHKTRNLECSTCRNKSRRAKNKEVIFSLLGGKCKMCGYDKTYHALDLHHLDPNQKEFTISHAYHLSLDKLIQESKKCILLCSNCHRELHGGVVQLAETHGT